MSRFHAWVDELHFGNLASSKLVVIFGLLLMFLTPLIGRWWLIPSGVFAAVWVGYLIWRTYWVAKTGLIGGGPTDFKRNADG